MLLWYFDLNTVDIWNIWNSAIQNKAMLFTDHIDKSLSYNFSVYILHGCAESTPFHPI